MSGPSPFGTHPTCSLMSVDVRLYGLTLDETFGLIFLASSTEYEVMAHYGRPVLNA
jgi:hypothetical protein